MPTQLTSKIESDSMLNLNWKDNSNNELKFEIERMNGNNSFKRIYTASANQTTFQDTSFFPGIERAYRVRAVNERGASAFANPPPIEPSGLSYELGDDGVSLNLSWVYNSWGEEGFQIERKQGDGSYITIGTSPFNVTTFSDTHLDPGETYFYRVNAFHTVLGSSFYNAEIQLLITGLSDRNDLSWSIYPNPTDGALKIELEDQPSSAVSIMILNPLRVIEKMFRVPVNHGEISLDVSELNSGIHILQVKSNGDCSSHVVVKR